MEPVVRRARKTDYKHLKTFRKEHFKMSFPNLRYNRNLDEEKFKKEIGKPGTFVLVLDNEPIGYLYVEVGKYLGHQLGELQDIHLNKKHRGKGYSHILMKFAMEYFTKKKVKEITLGTDLKNKIAISLYRKYGFKDWRIRMKKRMS